MTVKTQKVYEKTEAVKATRKKYRKMYEKTEAGKATRKKYAQTKSGRKAACQASIRKYDPGFTISDSDWNTHWNTTECALCGKTLPIGADFDKQFDHKHGTSIYRGSLCRRCNLLLGYAQDSADILNKALLYLGGLL